MKRTAFKTEYAKVRVKSRRPYTQIYLIRHCHPNYKLQEKCGDANMPLSTEGVRQRKHLTKYLLDFKIDKVYSSELKRARQSASTFINKSKKKLIINPRLNELHWEHWYNMKYFNLSEEGRKKKLKAYDPLDRELDRMQAEARRAIAEIYRQNKGKKVALFTHGNFIKSLLTGILNADIIGFLTLEVFQSSINKIVIDRDGHIKINYINNIRHLPEPPKEDLFFNLSLYEEK